MADENMLEGLESAVLLRIARHRKRRTASVKVLVTLLMTFASGASGVLVGKLETHARSAGVEAVLLADEVDITPASLLSDN